MQRFISRTDRKSTERKLRWSVLASVCACALTPTASALETQRIASNLANPVFLTSPANDARLFVVERAGTVRILGANPATPFLDISTLVESQTGERGLLGLAFDPNYASNRKFYVNYIDKITLDTVVASYQTFAGQPGLADPNSGQVLLTVDQPAGRSNHKAGWIGFRPGEANNLYIATGDGGGGDDPDNNGQNLNSNLGKILRVDVSGDDFVADPNRNYAIPDGNPFAGATAGNDEIWAYGLRNPYRNSFDSLTGDFWIGDVGQNAREEIDFEGGGSAGGVNYGWRPKEGSIPTPGIGDPIPAGLVDPVHEYEHPGGGSRSVTGGYVYRGSALAGLQGTYFFADFITDQIWSFRYVNGNVTDFTDRTAELANGFGVESISSFGEDAAGNLYIVDYNGEVFALVPEPSTWAMMLAALLPLGLVVRRRFSHDTR